MRIADIFRHDLSREIKEIIKVDDADVEDVGQEIREYVVTGHIHDAFVELLDQYQESIQKPTEVVNAWVSGFFGSGKSSFAVFVDLSSSRNVAKEGESVVLPLYRELLTRLDYARNFALAELEITLEADGELDGFVAAFHEATGHDWRARRDKALALNEASKALHHLKPDTYPSADSYARTRP